MAKSKSTLSTHQHIIAVPFGVSLIERVADILESGCPSGRDLSRMGVCFMGKRPEHFLKRELARRRGALIPPVFYTLDSFIHALFRQSDAYATGTMLTPMDATYLLYQLICEEIPSLVKGRNFAAFLPWARELMAFIDHVDKESWQHDPLGHIEEQATIGFDVPPDINELLGSIRRIRTAYHAYMHKHHTYSEGFCYYQAAQHAATCAVPACDELLFCDLLLVHRTERHIMTTLVERGLARMVFQGDDRSWPLLAEWAEVLRVPLHPDKKSSSAHTKPTVTLYAGTDVHTETSLVRRILSKLPAPESTVIVVPQADHIIPLMSELAESITECNVSMGYPLSRSTVVSLIEVIAKAQETRKDTLYYVRDYINVLRHPLIKNLSGADVDASVTRTIVHVIEECVLGIISNEWGGSLFVNLEALERTPELHHAAIERVRTAHARACTPETIRSVIRYLHDVALCRWESLATFHMLATSVESFMQVLLTNSPLADYPLNLSIVERIMNYLDELRMARFLNEPFAQADIFAIFLQFLYAERVSFKGTPLKGLQILGSLETRSLAFDNVIIMDMNEGVIPRTNRYLPLIPREVLLMLGMPHYEQEEEVQRYHFMKLVASARTVHLVYIDDAEHERSRFIEELTLPGTDLIAGPLRTVRGVYPAALTQIPREMTKTSAVLDRLSSLEYSASSINTYMECPLRFYYQYVLRLHEKEELGEEPEARDIGTFMHELLEDAFQPFLGKKPVIDDAFRAHLFALFEERFKKTFVPTMKTDSFMVHDVMVHYLTQFCDAEAERPVAVIKGLEVTYHDTIRIGKNTIQLIAKIDRIDQLPDNSLLILDYKTGASAKLPVTVETLTRGNLATREDMCKRIRSFQLPLYLDIAMKQYATIPLDAALYSLRTGKRTSFAASVEPYPFAQSRVIVHTALVALLGEILDPAYPFVPDAEQGHCTECPFRNSCGVG